MEYGGGTLHAPTSHSGTVNVVGDSVSLRLCYKVVVCANISPVRCRGLNSEMARRKVIPDEEIFRILFEDQGNEDYCQF